MCGYRPWQATLTGKKEKKDKVFGVFFALPFRTVYHGLAKCQTRFHGNKELYFILFAAIIQI